MQTEWDNQSFAPALAAFGNPLLDLCVRLADDTVLVHLGLADDQQKEVTAEEMGAILNSVQSLPKKYCPGGGALNTLRIFQWLVGHPKYSIFFGATGDDDRGKILKKLIVKSGVVARFAEHSDLQTGTAVALIHGSYRTLVAHLGAANVYRLEDFVRENNEQVVAAVQLVYIENYFFCHSAPVVWEIIKICKANGVAVAFNLSGEYLFDSCGAEIIKCIKCVNMVFGSENEFRALSRSMGIMSENLQDVVHMVCEMGVGVPNDFASQEVNSLKMENIQTLGKVVVATRGQQPVVCGCEGVGEVQIAVPTFSGIVEDTTGAGDSFVAGFLFGVLKRQSLSDCVLIGCYTASEVIQQIGCCPPNHRPLPTASITKSAGCE